MRLDDLQIERYSRQLVLPEIGVEGQTRLLASHVVVHGRGVAAERAVAYLAAAGVGHVSADPTLHDAVDTAQTDVRIDAPVAGARADAAIVVGEGPTVPAPTCWIADGRLGLTPPCPACARAALPAEPPAAPPFDELREALLGTVAATETVKRLLGIGVPLRGRVLTVGATAAEVATVAIAPRPACAACNPPGS